MDVTVIVATYGDDYWQRLATARAIPSAQRLGVPVIHAHADTLQNARNAGLDQAATSHLIYLDADDQLEPGYITAMMAGTKDLRAPHVRYVFRGRGQRPAFPRVAGHTHECTGGCLMDGNWLIIGTMAPVALLRQVGGWHDYPWSEDWDIWLRCHLAGATVEGVPDAVYRAHVNPRSRNRSASHEMKMATHRAIAHANGIPAP